MRTTITLDRSILGALQKETGLRSKSKAVLTAVQDYLRRRRLARVLNRSGSYKFHSQTAAWRHLER
jgi:Arc/MetJ family transcription regulator